MIDGRDRQRDAVKQFDPGIQRLRNEVMCCVYCRHSRACAADYLSWETASVRGAEAIFLLLWRRINGFFKRTGYSLAQLGR